MDYEITDYALLLKYVYPCIEFWYENKELALKSGKIWRENFYKFVSPELLGKLKLIAMGVERPNHECEEKIGFIIPFAISFLKKLGKTREGLIIIDEEVIRRYFWEIHNSLLEGEEEVHELCKVERGVIEEIKGGYGKVRLRNGVREVKLDFIENPRVGDEVTVHFFYACEKINLSSR